MCCECIHSCPVWWKKALRCNCALVVEDDDKPGMKGMNVIRIQLFFSFLHLDKYYPLGHVHWLSGSQLLDDLPIPQLACGESNSMFDNMDGSCQLVFTLMHFYEGFTSKSFLFLVLIFCLLILITLKPLMHSKPTM